jgi:hypothetical protein
MVKEDVLQLTSEHFKEERRIVEQERRKRQK